MNNPHILLTTDFSEESFAAFDPCAELAAQLGGRITLLHVVAELTAIPHGSPLAPAQEPPDLAQHVKEASKQLEQARTRFGSDMSVEVALETGEEPDETISDYAKAHGVDLIAMATHGRSGIRRLVVGSVTEGVLRRARKPVIVFPA